CPICLEEVVPDATECPACEESFAGPMSAPASSLPAVQPRGSWLGLHWRPALIFGVLASLLVTGLVLRRLAPARAAAVVEVPMPAAAVPSCQTACWHGEACEEGECVWQPRNDAGHLTSEQLTIVGPFPMP